MSVFSDYLKACINQHMAVTESSQNELIVACGVNRSTFFQCLKGERLPTEKLFQTILEQLMVSPDEKAELERLYRVAQVGSECLRRRESVQRCLRVLAEPVMRQKRELTPNGTLLEGAPRIVEGREAVFRMLDELVSWELAKDCPNIDLFLPPQCRRIFGELAEVLRSGDGKRVRLRQMVQMSEKQERKELESLALLRLASRFLPSERDNYELYYYYADSRYDEMVGVLYPYSVIATDGILLLNGTLEGALLSTNPEVREQSQMQFQDNLERCRPFFLRSTEKALTEEVLGRWRGEKLKIYYLSTIPYLPAYLPSATVSKLRRKYARKDSKESTLIYHKNLKRNTEPIGFCTEEGIWNFARTGVQAEWLEFEIVEMEDRVEMLRHLLRSITRKGELYLLDEEQVPVSDRKSLTVFDGKCVLLCSWEEEEMHTCQFVEQNLVYSFMDYFQGLAKGQGQSDRPPVRPRAHLERVLQETIAWCEAELEKIAPKG